MTAAFHAVALVLVCSSAQVEYPDVFVDRVDQIPDLGQSLIPVDARDGDAYCAPVAVANSLCYLAANGYPKLVNGDPHAESGQLALANTLAGPEYMRTAPESGTSKESLLAGVDAFVRDHGYRVRSAEYNGIEIHFQPDEPPASRAPGLDWLKARLSAGAACWLQVGWYRKDGDDYRKTGGHWVTLTGYGADATGNPDPAVIIIRDPSPRAGRNPSSEFLRSRAIDGGQVHGWGLPQPAAGFSDITEGFALPDDADRAILEGAVVVELDSP
jgi:hypothetical protein